MFSNTTFLAVGLQLMSMNKLQLKLEKALLSSNIISSLCDNCGLIFLDNQLFIRVVMYAGVTLTNTPDRSNRKPVPTPTLPGKYGHVAKYFHSG